MSIVIDVIDKEYDETADYFKDSLKEKGYNNFIELGPCSNIVGAFVAEIERCTPLGSIELLRIWGHGNIGKQCLAGEACFTSKDFDTLAPLEWYFSGNSLVELHGCRVASTSVGEDFIRHLADLWNVRIRASQVDQKGMIDSTDWVCPVVEARPQTEGVFHLVCDEVKHVRRAK